MIEKIYEEIKKHGKKITTSDLKNKFSLNDEMLNNYLDELKISGKIIQEKNKFILFPEDYMIGDIAYTSSGNKIIFSNGIRYSVAPGEDDNFILNDIVSFTLNENNEAVVHSIQKRNINTITCRVEVRGGRKLIIPYYGEVEVFLNKDITESLLDGDVILVDIGTNDPKDKFVRSSYIKKIGNSNDPNIDEIEIAINYGFDNDYSDEYLEELKKLPTEVKEEDKIGRTDLTDLVSFTIDGINTKDMDDALSVKQSDNGNIIVYVHIASVDDYVKIGSALFERACDKTTSLYLNNSVFHMFHHLISNGICSLNPDVDRLTKTVRLEIDESGKIVNFEIFKSVINSRMKMNYDDVDKVLGDEEYPSEYEPYVNDLKLLNEASKRLEKRYAKVNGKLDFASSELEATFDDAGLATSIDNLQMGLGRKLIENLMIAANESVATYMSYSYLPGVYRIHETPEVEKVNSAIMSLNEAGYKIRRINDVSDPKAIQRILKSLENLEEYPILSSLLLRFMQRARYSTDNLGHFALGLDYYTHFTSPIRRLPDLLVHMVLSILLDESKVLQASDLKKMEDSLKKLCERSSIMERRADAAEKRASELMVLKFLRDFIGEETVGHVVNFGKQMEIRICEFDCILDEKALKDRFAYDTSKKKYYDPRTKQYINLGTALTVMISDVSIAEKTVKVVPIEIGSHAKVLKKEI